MPTRHQVSVVTIDHVSPDAGPIGCHAAGTGFEPMRASVGALVHAWPDPTLRANHATRTSLAAPPDAERHPRAQVMR